MAVRDMPEQQFKISCQITGRGCHSLQMIWRDDLPNVQNIGERHLPPLSTAAVFIVQLNEKAFESWDMLHLEFVVILLRHQLKRGKQNCQSTNTYFRIGESVRKLIVS